jgi:hypothetical protein
MNEFHEIAAVVVSEGNRMQEMVQDQFGASIVAEVFEPLTVEAQSLASVSEEVETSFLAVDQIVEEARALGGIEPQ